MVFRSLFLFFLAGSFLSPLSCTLPQGDHNLLGREKVSNKRRRRGRNIRLAKDTEADVRELVSGEREPKSLREPYNFPEEENPSDHRSKEVRIFDGNKDDDVIFQDDEVEKAPAPVVVVQQSPFEKERDIVDRFQNDPYETDFSKVVFPVKASTSNKMILNLEKNQVSLRASTVPKNRNLQLVAGFNGLLLREGSLLELYSFSGSLTYVLKFLGEVNWTQNAKSGSLVHKGQEIGTTSRPVIVSLLRDNEPITICAKPSEEGKVIVHYSFDENSGC